MDELTSTLRGLCQRNRDGSAVHRGRMYGCNLSLESGTEKDAWHRGASMYEPATPASRILRPSVSPTVSSIATVAMCSAVAIPDSRDAAAVKSGPTRAAGGKSGWLPEADPKVSAVMQSCGKGEHVKCFTR
jgi:hypothetical protein